MFAHAAALLGSTLLVFALVASACQMPPVHAVEPTATVNWVRVAPAVKSTPAADQTPADFVAQPAAAADQPATVRAIEPVATPLAPSPTPAVLARTAVRASVSAATTAKLAPAAVISHGPVDGAVALTFDMGKTDPGTTAQILATLRARRVLATFFVTGEWAAANPALMRQIVADGHAVGNHSFNHPSFLKLTPAEMADQLERTDKVLAAFTGDSTRPLFRPPYGDYNREVLKTLGERGYDCIIWTVDALDWRPDATVDGITRRVLAGTRPGAIVLFHGYLGKTAEAVPTIIARLQQRGSRFATVPDLLDKGYAQQRPRDHHLPS